MQIQDENIFVANKKSIRGIVMMRGVGDKSERIDHGVDVEDSADTGHTLDRESLRCHGHLR